METAVTLRNNDRESEFVHPDGEWGYVIAMSFVVFMLVSLVPVSSFGLYYGNFLASVGDEASGTALSTSIFLAALSFIGFLSSFLLKKYSYRFVGLVGAVSYSVGGFSEVFSQTFIQMIMSFSILKGIGFGLMYASSLTILNEYFDKKQSFMMGVSQTFITMSAIVCPLILAHAMEHMGFRNVLWLLAGLSLLNFPAIATFIPVKRYNKPNSPETPKKQVIQTISVPDYHTKLQSEPLLDIKGEVENKRMVLKQGNENKIFLSSMKTWLLDTLGLRLYGDIRYLIMATGLALSFNSDYNFTVIIRLLLNSSNYNSSDIARMIMVYFLLDLISRILYSIYTYFYTINNKLTFLWTTFIIAVWRIVFTLCEGHVWKMIALGLIGLTRGIMETTLPLVVSEMYKDNFSTAYSLYMVLGGCIGLIMGSLTGYVKELTGSDSIIVYFYASTNFITCLAWIGEIVFLRIFRKKH